MQFKNIVAVIATLAIGNTLAAPAAQPEAEAVAEAKIDERAAAYRTYGAAGWYGGYYYPNGYFLQANYYYPYGAYYYQNQWYGPNAVKLCSNGYYYYYCSY